MILKREKSVAWNIKILKLEQFCILKLGVSFCQGYKNNKMCQTHLFY